MMTVVYILLFILCLSTLIMVHEAGHLLTAKAFKVYCFEYAIGFGPRLLSYKRKKGETRFSIRAIPFGGFVSMYGESDTVPDDVDASTIDPSRSLNNIKKWKKAIIMTAGIAMNFLLALLVFFIYEVAFPSHILRLAHIEVSKGSLAEQAGLASHDYVYTPMLQSKNYVFYDNNALLSYEDDSSRNVFFGYEYGSMTYKSLDLYSHAIAFYQDNLGEIVAPGTPISYEEAINGDYSSEEFLENSITGYLRAESKFKEINNNTYSIRIAITENYLDEVDKAFFADLTMSKDEADKFALVPIGNTISISGDIYKDSKKNYNVMDVVDATHFHTTFADTSYGNVLTRKVKINEQDTYPNKINFTMYVLDEATNIHQGDAKPFGDVTLTNGRLPKNIGLKMQMDEYRNNFGSAVKNTFVDFGNSATLIYRGLGSLFTADGWKNVGGIIAIGVSSTKILQDYGFGTFLYFWAMISVNLGIVNLLPFPGLDGWHFLVTIVEGITRKEIPAKFKNVMSAIGLILLFSLMILIVIKDIIMVI